MCQKWEGDCGLWVLNEMIKKIHTESLKKIVEAVWELSANPQTTITLPFLTHNISAIGGVWGHSMDNRYHLRIFQQPH